jgi:hypothetical protein
MALKDLVWFEEERPGDSGPRGFTQVALMETIIVALLFPKTQSGKAPLIE